MSVGSIANMRGTATVGTVLTAAVRRLRVSDSPRLDAEMLLAHALRCTRAELFRDRDRELTNSERQRFRALLCERMRHVPIAYLVGHREFWSLDLEVTRATLIPRPETELLVELALELIPEDDGCRVVDLGTGSGAIALAIARERPRAHIIATDISAAALALARGNAVRLGVANVEFRGSDWWLPLAGERFDLVVSNPPYVAERDPHLTQGDVQFEPESALAAGVDGLEALRAIAAGCFAHLQDRAAVLLEHGAGQGEAVRALAQANGLVDAATFSDLAGCERVTRAHRE